MTFSIRTALLVTTFLTLWLGAIFSRSPVALEITSLITVLLLFLSLPFAIFDSNNGRRPFWAGFCTLGLGFLLAISIVGVSIDKSANAIANAVMEIPGASSVPPSSTEGARAVQYMTKDGKVAAARMQPITLTVTMREAVLDAIPYLFMFVVALIGGISVHYLAHGNRTSQSAG